MGGEDLRERLKDEAFKNKLQEVFARQSGTGQGTGVPKTVETNLKAFLERVDELAANSQSSRPQVSQQIAGEDRLILWWDKEANMFGRSIANIAVSKWPYEKSQSRAEFQEYLEKRTDFGRRLLLDNAHEMTVPANVEPGEAETDSILKKAKNLWLDGLRAQEMDDPQTALTKFQEARLELEQEQGDESKNERARYTWWEALVLNGMSRRDEALKLIRESLEDQGFFSAGGTDNVTREDFQNLLLFLARGKIHANGQLPEDIKDLENIADRLAGARNRSTDKQAEDRCQITEFNISKCQVSLKPPEVDAEALEELTRKYKDYLDLIKQEDSSGQTDAPRTNRQRNTVRLVADWTNAYGLGLRSAGLSSVGLEDADRKRKLLKNTLATGVSEIRRWQNSLTVGVEEGRPPSASDILSLAQAHADLGELLTAYDLAHDALQVISPKRDAVAEMVYAVTFVGLLEDRLGRPDLAKETWKALLDSWTTDLPAGSKRQNLRINLPWWQAVADFEMGLYKPAWNTMQTVQKELFESGLPVLEVEDSLSRIRYFLPQIAIGLENFEDVARLVSEWETPLKGTSSLEIDLPRRLAMCRLCIAQASYCLNKPGDASQQIAEGISLLSLSAEAFGSRYALVDAELRLLEAEIMAFDDRSEAQKAENRALIKMIETAVERLETLGGAMLYQWSGVVSGPEERFKGWFYWDLVRVATGIATAAAIYLRMHDRNKAEELAHSVEEKWLSFDDWRKSGRGLDREDWLKRITAVPRALADAVLGRRPNANSNPAAAFKESDRGRRYHRIFEYCGTS